MNKFKLFAGITAICLLTTGCAENENISQSTSEQSSSVSEMESSSQSDKNPNILSDEKIPLQANTVSMKTPSEKDLLPLW